MRDTTQYAPTPIGTATSGIFSTNTPSNDHVSIGIPHQTRTRASFRCQVRRSCTASVIRLPPNGSGFCSGPLSAGGNVYQTTLVTHSPGE